MPDIIERTVRRYYSIAGITAMHRGAQLKGTVPDPDFPCDVPEYVLIGPAAELMPLVKATALRLKRNAPLAHKKDKGKPSRATTRSHRASRGSSCTSPTGGDKYGHACCVAFCGNQIGEGGGAETLRHVRSRHTSRIKKKVDGPRHGSPSMVWGRPKLDFHRCVVGGLQKSEDQAMHVWGRPS